MTSEKLFDGDNGEHITLLEEEEEDEDEQETNANDEFHVEAPPTGQTTWTAIQLETKLMNIEQN